MHGYHEKSGTMFFAEINKNAVTCWNSRRSSLLRPSNMAQVARDNVSLVYPSDLNVREIWQGRFMKLEQEVGRKDVQNNFLFFSLLFLSSSRLNLLACECSQVVGDDLWVMSNRMIRHIYSKLDIDDYNFRIFRAPVREAIKGTICESTSNVRRVLKGKTKIWSISDTLQFAYRFRNLISLYHHFNLWINK